MAVRNREIRNPTLSFRVSAQLHLSPWPSEHSFACVLSSCCHRRIRQLFLCALSRTYEAMLDGRSTHAVATHPSTCRLCLFYSELLRGGRGVMGDHGGAEGVHRTPQRAYGFVVSARGMSECMTSTCRSGMSIHPRIGHPPACRAFFDSPFTFQSSPKHESCSAQVPFPTASTTTRPDTHTYTHSPHSPSRSRRSDKTWPPSTDHVRRSRSTPNVPYSIVYAQQRHELERRRQLHARWEPL